MKDQKRPKYSSPVLEVRKIFNSSNLIIVYKYSYNLVSYFYNFQMEVSMPSLYPHMWSTTK